MPVLHLFLEPEGMRRYEFALYDSESDTDTIEPKL
jgi:hypothetical protein